MVQVNTNKLYQEPMQLIEVRDKHTAKEFIQVNVGINQKDPAYIRPLDKDIERAFDPHLNPTFQHGEATRWILKDDQGRLIGRIAAFVNCKYANKEDELRVGGIGFFDCMNDQQAADMLFDVSKHWLLQRGMEAMDGPINFGERDRWWGLVTKGFQSPLYCMNFNPPYYQQLFEQYGFRTFYNQLCFAVEMRKQFHPKLYSRHAAVAADPAFSIHTINRNQLEKFASDFTYIYNKAWAQHEGLKELENDQVLTIFKQMKPVMDERVVWFAYHHEEPVGMFINLPDLNYWFKYLNGKLDWWHKLKLLYVTKTKVNRKMVGVVFGVIPEYHAKGIDAYMIVRAGEDLKQTQYLTTEMQWIGDFNPKMINMVRRFGETENSRTLTTYRYLFDPAREFRPHPILK